MIEALLISLKLSSLTTVLLILISVPLAYLLAFYRFFGKTLLEFLLLSPIVLPPTVLGFYLMVILSPESLIGGLFKDIFGKTFLFSFEGILIGSLIYSLPFGVFPVRDSFAGIPKRHLEIAYVYGYSSLEAFFRVVLPQSWRGILTAGALVFSHTLGEFGVVLMLGGNIPGETQTLSIYIYDEVQALNYKEANEASLLLLSASFLSLVLISLIGRRRFRLTQG